MIWARCNFVKIHFHCINFLVVLIKNYYCEGLHPEFELIQNKLEQLLEFPLNFIGVRDFVFSGELQFEDILDAELD